MALSEGLKGFVNFFTKSFNDSVKLFNSEMLDENKIYIDKWVGLLSFESDVDKQEKRKVLLEMCDL